MEFDEVLSLDPEDSIWNGNDPRPADSVESWEPVDMPNVFLSSGGGRAASSVCSCPSDFECDGLTSIGERGPLVGIPEIGEGGTKGNDSRIESAPAEAAERTDPLESL